MISAHTAERPAAYDYIVLGAGPAGLQLGHFLQSAGRNHVILEAQDRPGAFFRRFPRHRRLLSINKIHTGSEDAEINLRWDWNSLLSNGSGPLFNEFSRTYYPNADELCEYLDHYAQRHSLNVRYETQIQRVSRSGRFVLHDQRGQEYQARRLVVATGTSHPYLPPIPGIELAERYVDVSVNPAEFEGQRVLIIGKGNSAFETANHLVETTARIHLVSPTSVQMAWSTHHPGNLRAINNHYLDTYQLKSQNAALDGVVTRIQREDGEYVVSVAYAHARGQTEQLRYDRVLVCTGFRFDDAIFDETCKPELTINGRFPRLTSAWESTSVENLFFAGMLMYSRDVKKASSPFIHGFRYNIRALHRIFECRFHGLTWPSQVIEAAPDALADALLERINRTSALWQQFGFLCDLVTLGADGSAARHYEELPVDYVADSGLVSGPRYLTLTLEYGSRQLNPFSVPRDPRPEGAASSTFLHPILRYYERGQPIMEHHVLENLFGEWRDEVLHRGPLRAFLATVNAASDRLPASTPEVA